MVRNDINKMELETAPSFPTFSSECIALDLVNDQYDKNGSEIYPYKIKQEPQTR
jgi:hypothetical protein